MAGGDTEQGATDTGQTDPERGFFEGKSAGPSFGDDVARVARRKPSTWRSPLLLVVIVAACGYLGYGLIPDVRYFFAPTTPADLGKAGHLDLSKAHENAYVHVAGLSSVLKITYKQFNRRYEVYYLLGSRVFVREPFAKRAHKGADDVWASFDGSGRLVDLDRDPEYANIKAFYAKRGFEFREPTWMVLAGVRPRQQWIYPAAVVLLGIIAAFNLFLLGRRLLGAR